MTTHLYLKNFEDPQLEKYFCNKVDNALRKAPSRSFCCGCLRKVSGGYSGTLKVNARHGRFVAELDNNDPKELVLELIKVLEKQFKVWRLFRFEERFEQAPDFCQVEWNKVDRHPVLCEDCDTARCPLSWETQKEA